MPFRHSLLLCRRLEYTARQTLFNTFLPGSIRGIFRRRTRMGHSFRYPGVLRTIPGILVPVCSTRFRVFPSTKNDGPRTTLAKAHEKAIRGKRKRIADMRAVVALYADCT